MKLKDQLREKIRTQGKSLDTFKTYWKWVRTFLQFARNKRGDWVHPSELDERHVTIWLTHLATREHVSPKTQNVALQSLCYLYRHVLNRPLVGVNAVRAKESDNIPVVLDDAELLAFFDQLDGIPLIASRMMYGCGLRIGDLINIRIKDLSFERKQIQLRTSKGGNQRFTPFPECLHDEARQQIERVKKLHAYDVRDQLNGVSLPYAFGRKCPSAHLNLAWYYLFAADDYSRCPDSGHLYRHHRDTGHISRMIKKAAEAAGINKRVTSHVMRHTWATHSNEQGVDIRTIQVLLGHKDIRTTEIYVHANQHKATAAKNPLASLLSREVKPLPRPQPQTIFRPRLWTGTD